MSDFSIDVTGRGRASVLPKSPLWAVSIRNGTVRPGLAQPSGDHKTVELQHHDVDRHRIERKL